MSKRDETRPLHAGQVVRVPIHATGQSGEGIGRFAGLALFVPGGAPGDVVDAKVTEIKKSYARANLVRLIEPSPHRVVPVCPVVGECGGCQLQHIAYPTQLDLKRQQVCDALERIGKLQGVTVLPTIGMAEPWGYRNKAQFPVGWRDGRIVAGFFAPGTHHIIDIETCAIQHPLGNRILADVKMLAQQLGLSIYDERSHRGLLRHVLARVGRDTGEAMAVLVTSGEEFRHGQELAKRLMSRIPALVSVVQNINPDRTNVVLGRESRLLAGRPTMIDRIGDLTFVISPRSFFQVNPIQTEALYGKALQYAALSGDETALDLYCGIGTISLFLARQARQVVGIESVPEAVADAGVNAERNGLTNVRFLCGDAATLLPKMAAEGFRADVIVLDPPRKGCDEPVLTAVGAMRPRRIVYLSCNPATLARDLAILAGQGYQTVEVQPVDMFPQTAHVECCSLLLRNVE